MSNHHPRYRICRCGNAFEVTTRYQRSCPSCKAAMAVAEESKSARPSKQCSRCRIEFEPAHRNQKYCPDCQEAKHDARHPLRACAKCGKETRDIRHSCCLECRRKATQSALNAKRKGSRRREYLREFEAMSLEEKEQQLIAAFAWVFGFDSQDSTVEEVEPEQLPHQDQDAIDAAFASIMEGFGL